MSHRVGVQSNKLHRVTDTATLIILLLFTIVFGFHHKFTEGKIIDEQVQTVEIKIEKVEVTQQVQKVVKPSTAKIPIAVDDEEELDDDVEFEIEKTDFSMEDAPPPPPPPVISDDDEVIDFFAVQEKPEIMGGNGAVYKYIEYPPMAKRAGIGGRVTLKFICSKEGIPTNIRVIQEKPKDMGFGQAAVKALSKARLKPGIQRDSPVAVSMTLPLFFKIK